MHIRKIVNDQNSKFDLRPFVVNMQILDGIYKGTATLENKVLYLLSGKINGRGRRRFVSLCSEK